MSFTVIWTTAAKNELANIWMSAINRNAVTAAAHTVDQLLGTTPQAFGSSRYDTVRTLIVRPLGVDYEVLALDRIVYVLTVWDLTKITPNGSAP